jgi:DNA helicase II / ATP-dependent DNA helicase PcrA
VDRGSRVRSLSTIDELRQQAIDLQDLAATTPAPLYVQACPGAGKTRVIVDRHLRSDPAPRRRGRALVSFTNVACNEIRQRCHDQGRPDLTRFPHFVGTIDTFIWLYLVRPFLAPDRTWRRIDSWDRIRAVAEVPEKIPLSAFQFRDELNPRSRTAQLLEQPSTAAILGKLKKEDRVSDAEAKALAARRGYTDAGYLTGHEVRVYATYHLQNPDLAISDTLKSRFEEIVIDEAQDCSNLDLTILQHLHDAGVPLVFVCDPDQAIYEFRGAEPKLVREFGAKLGTRLDLTGNWRSSPAICTFSATLRDPAGGRPADVPVGQHHDTATGVLLVPIDQQHTTLDAVATFQDHAERLGIPVDQQLVLAHNGQALPRTTYGGSPPPSEPSGARLAWAVGVLADPRFTSRHREVACDIVERALLRFWYSETDGQSVDAICELHGIDRVQFRRKAARIGSNVPSVDDGTLQTWCSAVNGLLKQHSPQLGLERSPQRGLLRVGSLGTQLPRIAANLPTSVTATSPRASVIHQVKGEEVDAVLIIIPDDKRAQPLVEAWTTNDSQSEITESVRVLYVAATRARRLLAITLPAGLLDVLRTYLCDQSIAQSQS